MRRTGWLAALILLSACGGPVAGNQVEMLDNTFRPDSLQVAAGQAVTFVNNGRAPHNVIADDGSFDSRDAIGRNHESEEAWELTLTEPGTYPYYCSLHAVQKDDGTWKGMVGTLVVTEGVAP